MNRGHCRTGARFERHNQGGGSGAQSVSRSGRYRHQGGCWSRTATHTITTNQATNPPGRTKPQPTRSWPKESTCSAEQARRHLFAWCGREWQCGCGCVGTCVCVTYCPLLTNKHLPPPHTHTLKHTQRTAGPTLAGSVAGIVGLGALHGAAEQAKDGEQGNDPTGDHQANEWRRVVANLHSRQVIMVASTGQTK